VTLGGRYTKDKREADRTLQNRFRLMDAASPSYAATAPFCDFVTVFSNCDLVIGQEPDPNIPDQVTSAKTDSSEFNTAATLNYRWTDDVSTYFRYATGYKSGGASESVDIGQLGRTYGPENVVTYEIGLKSFLFDRKLLLNAAVFDSKYDDAQLFFNTNPFDLSIVTALNAGKASVSGLELEAVFQPIESLRISFDYSYLDASYDEVIAPAGTTFDPASNPYSPYQVGDNVADVFSMPYAPENSYNVALDWEFAQFAKSSLSLILNYRWEDLIYLSAPVGKAAPGRELYTRPSTGLLDTRLSWRIDLANDRSGRIDVFANNVLDEEWELHAIANGAAISVPAPDGSATPAGYSTRDVAWAERRTLGINFVYEF
jgi:iron complex outermembrane receptor protein